MTTKNISRLLMTFGLLSLGVASCDVLDPLDPGTGRPDDRRRHDDSIIVTPEDKIIYETGTIRKMTHFDGYTFWAFVADNGKRYEPTDLTADFMQDGHRVKLVAKIVDDWSTPYRFGDLIEILEITSLGLLPQSDAAHVQQGRQ